MNARLRDSFLATAIRTLRSYSLYSPFEKGKDRINAIVNRCARATSGTCKMNIRSSDGRRFHITPSERQYQMGLLGKGVYEKAETALLARLVSKGMVALDVGANYGWHTTLLSKLVGPTGRVYAFEPYPPTYQALVKNCRENGCANVVTELLALGCAAQRRSIHLMPGEACGNASLYKTTERQGVELECEVATLDAYLTSKGIEGIDFIKCDVEGCELAVLQGACSCLHRDRPAILIEVNRKTSEAAGYSIGDLRRILVEELGYQCHLLSGGLANVEPLAPSGWDSLTLSNVFCQPPESSLLG